MKTSEHVFIEFAREGANVARELFAPACDRIEIGGSIRRATAEHVKDIEIVAVGKTIPEPGTMFDARDVNALHVLTDACKAGRHATVRVPTGKAAKWGARYRVLATHARRKWIKIDLFIVDAAAWFPQLVIRTGPWDFGKMLVSDPLRGGVMPAGWRIAEHGRLQRRRFVSGFDVAWDTVEPESEAHFFELLKLPYIPPGKRSVRTLGEAAGKR